MDKFEIGDTCTWGCETWKCHATVVKKFTFILTWYKIQMSLEEISMPGETWWVPEGGLRKCET